MAPGRSGPGEVPASDRKARGPLLVVVDMQLVFASGAPWATPGFEQLERPVAGLVEAFGDRVAFTRFVLPADPRGSWETYYQTWAEVRLPGAARLFELAHPWAELARSTIDLPTFSKWGPELQSLVGEGGELVLCGVATDCCVLATALAASDDGVHVRVVSDAAAGATAEAHRRALAVLQGFRPQISVTTVAEELRRLAGPSQP